MARLSLELCQKASYPLVSIKDYISIYKEKFQAWLKESQVRSLIKNDKIDYVKHDDRIYVVINQRSMEGLSTPKNARIRIKKSLKEKTRWDLTDRRM
jgi:vacuolar-type H+-ATPase catalytic subunit A/Vma1